MPAARRHESRRRSVPASAVSMVWARGVRLGVLVGGPAEEGEERDRLRGPGPCDEARGQVAVAEGEARVVVHPLEDVVEVALARGGEPGGLLPDRPLERREDAGRPEARLAVEAVRPPLARAHGERRPHAVAVARGGRPRHERHRVHHVPVEDREGVAVVDVADRVEGRGEADAVDREPGRREAAAAGGEPGVELVVRREPGQGLHRAQRVARGDARESHQLLAVVAAGERGRRLGGGRGALRRHRHRLREPRGLALQGDRELLGGRAEGEADGEGPIAGGAHPQGERSALEPHEREAALRVARRLALAVGHADPGVRNALAGPRVDHASSQLDAPLGARHGREQQSEGERDAKDGPSRRADSTAGFGSWPCREGSHVPPARASPPKRSSLQLHCEASPTGARAGPSPARPERGVANPMPPPDERCPAVFGELGPDRPVPVAGQKTAVRSRDGGRLNGRRGPPSSGPRTCAGCGPASRPGGPPRRGSSG